VAKLDAARIADRDAVLIIVLNGGSGLWNDRDEVMSLGSAP